MTLNIKDVPFLPVCRGAKGSFPSSLLPITATLTFARCGNGMQNRNTKVWDQTHLSSQLHSASVACVGVG